MRFCPSDGLGQRVASWDGTPLDVDVTLPATGAGPFPTIVMLHGLGQDKTAFEDTTPAGTQALTADYNTNFYAGRGYAVVTPTARGFGNSCGAAGRTSPGCARGWVHIDDARFEARDVQHLLGILVDEGIAAPGALGTTGISYGGGTSAQLAFLKDRIERPDGSFAAWTSPAGTPLRISAAYPRWGWASLASSLVPNGRDSSGTAPDGSQILVSRGSYRITAGQAGRIGFQLDGNAFTFAPGDRPKLEILSADSPYARPSNGVSTTYATDLQVTLPTAEAEP